MKKITQKYPVLSFLLLCLGLVYGILIPCLLLGIPGEQLKPLKIWFALTPVIAVSIITGLAEGEEGIARLFGHFWKKGVYWGWYLLALTGFTVLAMTAITIRYFLDGFFPPGEDFGPISAFLALSIPLLLFPGFTEEFAWRGFLQTRLQQKMPAFWACMLVVIYISKSSTIMPLTILYTLEVWPFVKVNWLKTMAERKQGPFSNN